MESIILLCVLLVAAVTVTKPEFKDRVIAPAVDWAFKQFSKDPASGWAYRPAPQEEIQTVAGRRAVVGQIQGVAKVLSIQQSQKGLAIFIAMGNSARPLNSGRFQIEWQNNADGDPIPYIHPRGEYVRQSDMKRFAGETAYIHLLAKRLDDGRIILPDNIEKNTWLRFNIASTDSTGTEGIPLELSPA